MYLKRLELQGFKSFADKTIIKFESGITAVVGPNGSGKSNISDAIRWVLGEQRVKSLRGSKMEDVIFSGTTDRGSQGFAEVTMVFDNRDKALAVEYAEVAVTRRMFRTGDSEYYINKTGCRRKDIRELFMDTGVGKDGYSIIGQGRIDDILSTKSEERRNIFEEAAGIVKYKTRKEEAEKKLDKTRDNLLRIDDIVSELEKQVGPLKKQSSNARRYMELREEYQAIDIELFKLEFDELKSEQSRVGLELSNLEGSIRKREAEKLSLDSDSEEVGEDLKKAEAKIEQAIQKKYGLQSEGERLEGEIRLLKERSKGLDETIARYNAEKKDLKKASEEKEKSLGELRIRYSQSELRLEEKNRLVAEKEKVLGELSRQIGEIQKGIQNKKDKIFESLNERSEKNLSLNTLSSYSENLRARKTQIEAELKELSGNKDKIAKENEEISKSLVNLDEEIKGLYGKMESLEDSRQKLLELNSNLEGEIEDLKADYGSKKSNLKFLEEMKEEYEGYYRGVKNFLTQAKDREELSCGLDGVVAEIVAVDKTYEKAIEVALGGGLQNIVVEDRRHAQRCIEYLKAKKLGRITFLPRDSVKPRALNQAEKSLLSEGGVIGLASSLIGYEEKFKGIFENLLGRVIIVDNMDTMIEVSKKYGSTVKMVTLEGDVLNPGGSMTGGSFKGNNLSLLGRERQIKEIYKEIDEKKSLYKKLSSDLECHKAEVEKIENSRKKAESDLNDLKLKKNSLENKYSYDSENERSIDKKLIGFQQELGQIAREFEKAEKNREKIAGELEAIDKTISLLELEIDKENGLYEDESRRYTEKSNELTEYRIENASALESYRNMEGEISRLQGDIDGAVKRHGELESEVEAISLRKNSISEQIKVTNLSLEQNAESKKILEGDLASRIDQKQKLELGLKSVLEKIEEIQASIDLDRNRHMEGQLQLEKVEIKLDSLRSRIWEEYELSYGQIADREALGISRDELRAKHSSLKSEIKSIGSVNLDAIEEYEVVSERYEFLSKQRDDLIEAEKSLKQVIRDMDKKMKEQFKDKFEEIREHFKEVFVELFGGGKADILLEDTDDLLSSGIEIIAQPPGKRLQSLSLLSGGERALTAIAILFAILKTRSTPFCILDEIEAALDEANVYRYAQYLESFAEETQFIVITHRRGTMESANTLYGITMEQSGVSKVLSVKLTDELIESSQK